MPRPRPVLWAARLAATVSRGLPIGGRVGSFDRAQLGQIGEETFGARKLCGPEVLWTGRKSPRPGSAAPVARGPPLARGEGRRRYQRRATECWCSNQRSPRGKGLSPDLR